MDKEKSLRLMRFWLFGTFVIIFAAATVYAGVVIPPGGMAILSVPIYWIAMAAVAVLCILTYYIYKAYINRK